MGIASPVHEPLGPGDLWKTPGLKLPAGIQHVAHDLLEQGRAKDMSSAIRLAIGIMRNFAAGHNGRGQKVKPETQAAAQKVMAEFEAARAKAHATSHTGDESALALTWDPSKHPRAPKGSPTGGKFAPSGSSSQGGSKTSSGKPAAAPPDAYNQLMNMTPEQRQAYLDGLSPQELQALGRYVYGTKGVDAGMRTLITGALGSRGMSVTGFAGPPKKGAGGGGKGGGKGGKGGGASAAAKKAAAAAKHAAAAKAAAQRKAAAQQKHNAAAKAAADKRAAAAKAHAQRQQATAARQKAAAQAKTQRQQATAARQTAAAAKRTQLTGLRQQLAVTTDKTKRAALTLQIRRVAAGLPAVAPAKVAASHAASGGNLALASPSVMSGDGAAVTVNADQRRAWAKSGVAMPDGSFYIPNRRHVMKAVKALGRTPASKRPAVRAHIRKRARALGVPIPEGAK